MSVALSHFEVISEEWEKHKQRLEHDALLLRQVLEFENDGGGQPQSQRLLIGDRAEYPLAD